MDKIINSAANSPEKLCMIYTQQLKQSHFMYALYITSETRDLGPPKRKVYKIFQRVEIRMHQNYNQIVHKPITKGEDI